MGDDQALATLAQALLKCWHSGDRLVVLGNMLGPNGDPVRTLDWLLALRRRLLAAPGARTCDLVLLRGAQEEMWHKALRLQFALTPLRIFNWMPGARPGGRRRGLRLQHRRRPRRLPQRTVDDLALDRHVAQPSGRLWRPRRSAERLVACRPQRRRYDLLSAAGAAPARALDSQADAFW
jgi:serine/threonine protein phosphatase 1